MQGVMGFQCVRTASGAALHRRSKPPGPLKVCSRAEVRCADGKRTTRPDRLDIQFNNIINTLTTILLTMEITMSQNHFTLTFPLKTPEDAKELAEQLPPLMPGLFSVSDAIGTIYSSRFTILDQKTMIFIGDFDGEFGQLIAELGKHAGPVFDAIFPHVENPPSTPVADHVDAFAEWTAEHLLRAATLFSAYPDVTVKEIKAL